MKTREYLGQAYRLDQRINSKLEQVASLNDLATKCASTLTGMPRNPKRNTSMVADSVAKIVDLQAEINRDIDMLVDLKCDMVRIIKSVDNAEYQTLLELRYLCFKSWEQIACDLNYSVSWVLKIHHKALSAVDAVMIGKEQKNGLA